MRQMSLADDHWRSGRHYDFPSTWLAAHRGVRNHGMRDGESFALYNNIFNNNNNFCFRCMLNQKSVALRNIIHKIFVVILKFYDYLRSRRWKCEDGSYIHPNFNKLDKIFKNFEEFVVYFFRVVRKIAKTGYQPHLVQFLDVLNVNDYYSKKLLRSAS